MAAMRIVCVHQGFELYGSDRCFIESVAALREAWPQADIEVVVSHEGPIVEPLRAVATRVVIEPVFVLRRSELLTLIATAPFRLVPAIWRAFRRMRNADLVYVNTVVVFDYLLADEVPHVHNGTRWGTYLLGGDERAYRDKVRELREGLDRTGKPVAR